MRIVICVLLICLSFSSVFGDYPKRIVSGMPSITEMLFALGLEDRIVGVTTNCNYPSQARKKEKIGGFFLNLEKTVSLCPDLIVMLEDAQKRDIEKFIAYGLPVYTINPHSVEEVKKTLFELGDLTGTRKRAEEVVAEMEKRLKFVKYSVELAEFEEEFIASSVNAERMDDKGETTIIEYHVLNVRQPQVLVVVGLNPLMVVGGDTLIDDMLNYAGAQNIAKKTKAAYPQYSFENLLDENPDYIIIPEGLISQEQIKKDNRWNSLGAVRQNKIIFVNADILSRPGPRVVQAIEEIADFIYQ